MASSDERRIHELEVALHNATSKLKEVEQEAKTMVKEALAETLFVGAFREAVGRGRVDEADRDYWRELFLEDREAFDIAISHDWVQADQVVERSRMLWRV